MLIGIGGLVGAALGFLQPEVYLVLSLAISLGLVLISLALTTLKHLVFTTLEEAPILMMPIIIRLE